LRVKQKNILQYENAKEQLSTHLSIENIIKFSKLFDQFMDTKDDIFKPIKKNDVGNAKTTYR